MQRWRMLWMVVLALAARPDSLRAEVLISEFLAQNESGLADEDGDHSDWIEITNDGAATVDLAGWSLTDDPARPARWAFPAVSVAGGQRVVIFASGKDRRPPGGELHTNFSLDHHGGYLALNRPDGTVASVYQWYPEQRPDISYGAGQLSDGQDLVTALTPGKFYISAGPSPDAAWLSPAFDDAGWSPFVSGIGYQSATPRSGFPVAYWTLDDTNQNAVAGGPDLTLAGATYQAGVANAIGAGKSLHFARSQNAYATAFLDVSETACTVSFWFRTTQATTGLYMVGYGDLGSGGDDRHLQLSSGNLRARLFSHEIIASTGHNYADGQWHHVAHEYGARIGGERLFVDGTLVASGVKSSSDFTWQNSVTLGFSKDAAGGNFLEGEMDDVAIWNEALNESAIVSLAKGTPPTKVVSFAPVIGANVEGLMRGQTAAAFLRWPFSVNRPVAFNQAALKVRYDAGFVAYLDGTEVARRNAPPGLEGTGTAAAARSADDALLSETIDLSAFAALLGNGPHVLAIQALNDSVSSPDFLLTAELSAAVRTPAAGLYFDPPTPGLANGPGSAGFVDDTVLFPKRGFYSSPVTVSIRSATVGATIAYTTDGTEPSPAHGTQVPAGDPSAGASAAVSISSSTTLRAMAYKLGSGLRPTNVDAHSYLFLDQVLAQPAAPAGFPTPWKSGVARYAMDPAVVNHPLPGYSVADGLLALPSISVSCPPESLFGVPAGIYYDSLQRGPSAERMVTIEWINPDGSPGWHEPCGVRVQGNSSRDQHFTPKTSFRLVFRSEYGASKLRQDVFGGGVQSFDQLILRACSTDSFPVVDGPVSDGEQRWTNDAATYLRDQYMRDALNDLGSPNCRGRYVHLFLNGLYWGVYNLAERPTASFFAATFGGGKDDWDVLHDTGELHDGDAGAWNAMLGVVNDAALTDEARCQKLLGNNPDGTRNPAYPIYIHWPSFRDYMILHIAAGAEDWPDRNYWVGRRRGEASDGFHFVVWDQEITNNSLTRTSGRGSDKPFEAVDEYGPAVVYNRFRRVEPFRSLFRERIHELLFNHGGLSPDAQRTRWLRRQAEIDQAIVAESARWGDAAGDGLKLRETTWLNNMAWMNTPVTGYWDAILPVDVQRFRNVDLYPGVDQPEMSQRGGVVPAGYGLTLTAAVPAIYYTLDGTDPMAPDGSLSASALLYQGGLTANTVVAPGSVWKYLVTPAAAPAAWKQPGFDDSAWPAGPGQLGYGDGDEATVLGYGGDAAHRYPTTYFRKTFVLAEKASVQSAKVRLLRDDGAVVYVNGVEIARSNLPAGALGYQTLASSNAGGADESTYFYDCPFDPSLLQEGSNTLAVEVHKVSASDDDLSFDGAVEVVRAGAADHITLAGSGLVTARARSSTGEWSGVNAAYFTVGAQPPSGTNVVFSEIHYHPAPPTRPSELAVSTDGDDFEFLELMNISAAPVDFTGAHLAAGLQFDFPAGFTLAPGARCVVVRNLAAFQARYGTGRAVAGTFGFKGTDQTGLGNGGDTLALTVTDAGHVTTTVRSFAYSDHAPWPEAADGHGPSLLLRNPLSNPDHNLASNWIASADFGGSPGESGAEMTFAQWSVAYGDALNPSADNDGDGLPNAMEYALALNPLVRDPAGLPSGQIIQVDGQDYLGLTFRHRAAGADLSVLVETSADLNDWSGPPETVLVSRLDNGDDTVTETWRCALPHQEGGQQFIRVRAVLTP